MSWLDSHHVVSSTASHILIKHQGSRRLASWKDEDGVEIKKRTKEQAHARLKELREQIVSGKQAFMDIARTESDCGSAQDGGDLGEFQPGQMQKAFEDGVLAIEIGSISDVVDTDSGSHLIMRTG
eukprot:m.329757 g.329757  ORF g.329757 m.329757 type:complete len:125 (+) comp20450_c1_seq17:302-676(+)